MVLSREKQLESIILDIYWMARRYADGRLTYAVEMYNNAIERAVKLGLPIKSDPICGSYFAQDGDPLFEKVRRNRNAKTNVSQKTSRTSVKGCPSAFQKDSTASEQKAGILGQGKQNGASVQGRVSKDLRTKVNRSCECRYCLNLMIFRDLGHR